MNNIILVGFMGSGKTSLGKYISRHGYGFIDTDTFIENKTGRTIGDIFANEGEEYFRELETEVLKGMTEDGLHDTIIAVGGGLPIREINRELMHSLGRIVYLRANAQTLEQRLSGDCKRPLLQGGNLRERIDRLMAERKSVYEEIADIIIDTDGLTISETYLRIKERIV